MAMKAVPPEVLPAKIVVVFAPVLRIVAAPALEVLLKRITEPAAVPAPAPELKSEALPPVVESKKFTMPEAAVLDTRPSPALEVFWKFTKPELFTKTKLPSVAALVSVRSVFRLTLLKF